MTRIASADDVPKIIEMGKRFIAAVYEGDVAFNPDRIQALAEQMIGSPDGEIFLVERQGAVVGMLAVQFYAHPMSGELIATEVCWWVDEPYRGSGMSLFRRAEQWARERGAAIFQMIAPSDDVAAFYKRVGFKAIETTYQRRMS